MIFSLNPEIVAQEPVVFEEWASAEGVQEYFYKNVTKTDASRNVYVAGATLNSNGDYDLLITKFNQRGILQWTDTVAGPGGGHDFATDLDFDQSGNVVVGGSVAAGGSEGNNILVVKYNSAGNELWRYSHDHNGNNEGAASLVVDGDNSIYLTGATLQSTGYTDMITLKIDSNATLLWEEVTDYNNLHDAGIRIELSGAHAIVTGGGQLNSLTWKVWAMSFSRADGTEMGSTSSSGTDPGVEEVTDLVIDDEDNIYVAGSKVDGTTGYDMLLIKLDDDLNIEWTREWDGDGMTDKGSGVRVAPNGDVYLSGTTQTTAQGTDVVLLKYNQNGDLIWSQTYNGEHNGDDEGASLEWHDDGYLYVAGSSFVVSNLDYLTLKYDTTGALLWDITYNSPHNKNDRATNMAIDDEGDIIVSGQCAINDSTTTYYTVKYSEHSIDESILDHIGERNQGFMKQMGQLNRTDSVIADEVKYYNNRLHPMFYAQDEGLSFVLASSDSMLNYLEEDTIPLIDIDIQRMDLEFLNCDTACKVRAFKPLDYYSNHYFPHCAPGVVRIPHLEILYYETIWAGIDLFLSASNKAEYTFVLDVGSKPEDIEFTAVGADSLLLLNYGLTFSLTSDINDIEIGDFKAYQADSTGNLQELSWQPRFEITDSTIFFDDFGVYNTSIPLVISNVANTSNTQTDGFCWSTFLGGSGNDFPHATAVNNDEFALAGWSTAVFDFPYNYDLFTSVAVTPHGVVAKFDQEGELKWSNLFGGSFPTHTIFSDVAFDHNDHVLVVGYTESNDLVTEANDDAYYQDQTSSFAITSAFIAEFPTTGDELIWGTYFGGTGNDRAISIEVAQNNDRYITGFGDNSNGSIGEPDFPLFEGDFGAYFYESTSGQSGFIARFNDSNDLIWSSFVEGSYFIADLFVKSSLNLAILGGTNSNSLPVVNGGDENSLFNESLSGNTDILYGILTPGGQFEHLTYIGGSGADGIEFGFNIYSNSNKLAEDSQRHTYLIGFASDGLELQQQGNYIFHDDHTQNLMPFVYKIDDVSYELKYGSYLYDLSSDCESKVSSISIDVFDQMILSSHVRNPGGDCSVAWPLEPLNSAYFEDEIYNNSYTGHLLIQNEFQGAVYATYLGGSEYDYISNAFMLNGNLFLVGTTQSDNADVQLPLYDPDTDAYFQENIPGPWSDIFLSKICMDVVTDVNESNLPSVQDEFPFTVFPNPALSEFTVLSLSADVTLDELDLLDIRGKLIRNYSSPNNPLQQTIPIADLSTGIYIIRIRTNDSSYYSHKLVVK